MQCKEPLHFEFIIEFTRSTNRENVENIFLKKNESLYYEYSIVPIIICCIFYFFCIIFASKYYKKAGG